MRQLAQAGRCHAARLNENTHAGAGGGCQPAETSAGADDAPGNACPIEGFLRGFARDAGRWEGDERQRFLACKDRIRVLCKPDQRFAIKEMTELIAKPALRQHDIQFAIVLHLIEHAGERYRQLQIDQRIEPRELLQNDGETACDKILRDPETQATAQPALAKEGRDLLLRSNILRA